jgi:hypothetical protein
MIALFLKKKESFFVLRLKQPALPYELPFFIMFITYDINYNCIYIFRLIVGSENGALT